MPTQAEMFSSFNLSKRNANSCCRLHVSVMYGTGPVSRSAKSKQMLSWRTRGGLILPRSRNKIHESIFSSGAQKESKNQHTPTQHWRLLLCAEPAANALFPCHSIHSSPLQAGLMHSCPVPVHCRLVRSGPVRPGPVRSF